MLYVHVYWEEEPERISAWRRFEPNDVGGGSGRRLGNYTNEGGSKTRKPLTPCVGRGCSSPAQGGVPLPGGPSFASEVGMCVKRPFSLNPGAGGQRVSIRPHVEESCPVLCALCFRSPHPPFKLSSHPRWGLGGCFCLAHFCARG